LASLKLGILVSGSGTNLQAVLDAVANHSLDAEVLLVVSNVPEVRAIERARLAGVPHRVMSHRDYPNRDAFDQALVETLRAAGVEWVVLAGFMRVLTRTFLDAFERRIVNIHPALLPAFPGVHAQQQALDYGVKIAGCTVHFVDAGVDTGPVIAQRAVEVLDDDDATSLGSRILVQEHALLVEVLSWIAQGRVEVVSGEACVRPHVVVSSP
jgi:phosphoribosylglycinamide formyltransferase 1